MNSFDEQLALSSPPVPARSAELDAELAAVAAQAEQAAGPRRQWRSRTAAIGGLLVVGALGAGGAAAAAGLVPWWESAPSNGAVTTSTGSRCTLVFDVKQIEDPAAPVSQVARAQATEAAEEYLRDFDVSTLDLAELPALSAASAAPRPTVGSEAGPAMTVDEFEVDAVYAEVGRRMDEELMRQRLSRSAVSLAMLSSCDEEER